MIYYYSYELKIVQPPKMLLVKLAIGYLHHKSCITASNKQKNFSETFLENETIP